jgi:hypothetical protein
MEKRMQFDLLIDGPANPSRLAEVSLQLRSELSRITGLAAKLATQPAPTGARSGPEDPIWGQLALTFLGGGGAASALIVCLQSWIAQDSALRFRLRRANGSEIELDMRNLTRKDIQSAIRAVEALLKSE